MKNPLRSLSVRMAVLAAVAVTVASGSIGLLIHQSTESRQLYYGRLSAQGELAQTIVNGRQSNRPGPPPVVPKQLAARAKASDSAVTFYDDSDSSGPVMWAAEYYNGEVVTAEYPMSSERRDLQDLDRHTFYAALGTVAVLVPLAAFGAELAGRRLRRAARTAHRIAAGDLDARIAPRGRPGDEVHTSDNHKMGKVIAADTKFLTVERGLLSKTQYFVPLSAVNACNDGKAYLNLTKDELTRAHWDVPPAVATESGAPPVDR